MGIRQRRDSGKVIHSTRDRAGHQVTPGHRASASMQQVEVVMVAARPSCWCVYVDVCRGVAMRCTWCDRAGHQVTPGYRASASMQRVEAVMVTAQLVAMRCTWCDHAGHQVTPGHRASASMQQVEVVMVAARPSCWPGRRAGVSM